MKMLKKLAITTLVFSICFLSSITVSYASKDDGFNLIDWFHSQVDSMVNNSMTNIETSVNAKKEELMGKLRDQIQLEKQRAEEDLQQYKEEQLRIYHQQLKEIMDEQNEDSQEEEEMGSIDKVD